jgi:hypothetical protein
MDRVLFLAFTLLRKSEATALRWSDLETNGEVLRIWRQGGEKTTGRKSGGAAYRLRLHPIARAVLARQELRLRFAGRFDPEGPIWPRPQGGFRKGGDVIAHGIVRRLAYEAQLPGWRRWTVHCLRHTGAAMEAFYARGLGGLKHRGGWRSERMAAHYAQAALPPSAIPAGADDHRDEHANQGVVFAHAVNLLAVEIATADLSRRATSKGAQRARILETREAIRARIRALGTWAELARDAIGDVDTGKIPSEHMREASARITRVAHAAFVRARGDGIALEDARRLRNKAEKKQRDEWNRAIGTARRRLALNPNKET